MYKKIALLIALAAMCTGSLFPADAEYASLIAKRDLLKKRRNMFKKRRRQLVLPKKDHHLQIKDPESPLYTDLTKVIAETNKEIKEIDARIRQR